MIIPKYLFEFNEFRVNLVKLIQKNYSIIDKLELGNLPVTSQAPFLSL